MMRIVIIVLGLTLGFGLVLAVEGRMYHLRRFAAFAEPAAAQGLADDARLIKVFCASAGPGGNSSGLLSLAGFSALFGEGCEF
jgi:hypothetical protein